MEVRVSDGGVEAAIASRRSVRGYLPRPVERAQVERLLDLAARAPSGTNMQPWRVIALAGPELERFREGLVAAQRAEGAAAEWAYYPSPMPEPYLSRRRAVGWDLYGRLGIGRGDREKAQAHLENNLRFFGAPVGLICVIDRALAIGSWIDYGMFLQTLALAARAEGLDTCPMAIFADYPKPIRTLLDLPESDTIVCGMALGYEDKAAPANALRTPRVPAAEFASFRGF